MALYLHDVWVIQVVWREDLEFKFSFAGPVVARLVLVFLVLHQVGDYVGLTDVYQKAVTNLNWVLKLSKSAIASS